MSLLTRILVRAGVASAARYDDATSGQVSGNMRSFFREPRETKRRYPNVYDQLVLFYRQDPNAW